MTKKYDSNTIEKTTIAEGALIHAGFFKRRFGASRTWNGRLKIASMLDLWTTKGRDVANRAIYRGLGNEANVLSSSAALPYIFFCGKIADKEQDVT